MVGKKSLDNIHKTGKLLLVIQFSIKDFIFSQGLRDKYTNYKYTLLDVCLAELRVPILRHYIVLTYVKFLTRILIYLEVESFGSGRFFLGRSSVG